MSSFYKGFSSVTSWSLFGSLLPISTTAFWISTKPLYLRSMISKSMRCTCSQHWSTKRAQFSEIMHDCMSHNQRFKGEWIGLWSLAYLPYSPDLLPVDYHFFKQLNDFLQGKRFHNQQDAENAESSSNPKAWGFSLFVFYCKNKQIYF